MKPAHDAAPGALLSIKGCLQHRLESECVAHVVHLHGIAHVGGRETSLAHGAQRGDAREPPPAGWRRGFASTRSALLDAAMKPAHDAALGALLSIKGCLQHRLESECVALQPANGPVVFFLAAGRNGLMAKDAMNTGE